MWLSLIWTNEKVPAAACPAPWPNARDERIPPPAVQMSPVPAFDVASSDPHTVKPWFEGKLDFAPPVKDLAGRGFPLIGGRLDYIHNRPVAALVYQRRKHSINLFIWPSAPRPGATTTRVTQKGFHMIQWSNSGMTFWAVSDLNERELQEFARLIQD